MSRPDAAPLANATLHDRILGTLVGSALGDAVGLYTEFLKAPRAAAEYPSRRFSLAPPTPFARDMHRLKHQLGEWTDDTDHALLILLSFLHGTLSPADVAARLRVWVEQGLRALDSLPLGLGATVGAIVRDPAYLDNPVAAAHKVWKRGKCNVAPNGSVMRTHPLGMVSVFQSEEEAMDAAAAISAITHVDPRCVVACMIETALVRGLIRSEVVTEAHVDAVIERSVARYNTAVRPGMEREGTMGADEPGLDLNEVSLSEMVRWS
jgi:ADP-ribosylglycohydrolase